MRDLALLNAAWAIRDGGDWLRGELQLPVAYRVTDPSRQAGNTSKNNPVQPCLAAVRAVAARGSKLLENETTCQSFAPGPSRVA